MSISSIKAPYIPSGTEDFAVMRRRKTTLKKIPFTIADKTGFLPELLTSVDEITVFTRPIRFMKSSTLSMMSRFLSVKDAESNKDLFEGLEISKAQYAEFRSAYQGQFPVIHLTFKGIKKIISSWPEFKECLADIMEDLYRKNIEVMSSLDEYQKKQYIKIMRKEGSYIELSRSLANLATYNQHTIKKK